jgi:quinolinate synthase
MMPVCIGIVHRIYTSGQTGKIQEIVLESRSRKTVVTEIPMLSNLVSYQANKKFIIQKTSQDPVP